jgi:hypothetical protein
MCDIEWSSDHKTLLVRFASTTTNESQACVEHLVQYMKQVLDNGNLFTMRVDTSQMAASPGFPTVRMLVQFMKSYRPRCAAQMKGTAIMIENSVLRWLLNTAFSLQPPASPVHIVSTLPEADAYIQDAINGCGRTNCEYRYHKNEAQETLLSSADQQLLAL